MTCVQILLVEDDKMIVSGLEYALGQQGYGVTCRGDVASASEAIASNRFSLGILDLGLPDGSGFTLCEELSRKNIPVIILTAVDDEANTVRGLEMGADDYITKPFRLQELLARVKAVLRRQGGEATSVLSLGHGVEVNPQQARVLQNGKELALTALEYRLLLAFAEHRGQMLSRTQLLERIWDESGSFVEDNTLTVCIRRLREKLGDDSQNPQLIKTVRGMGYRLD